MKIVRNWIIAFVVELLAVICVFLMAPAVKDKQESELFLESYHGRYYVKVSSQDDSNRIKVLGSNGSAQEYETFTIRRMEDASVDIKWVSEEEAMVYVQSEHQEIIRTICVKFSDSGTKIQIYPVSINENDQTEETPAQQEPVKEEEATVSDEIHTPVVASIQEIVSASDIEEVMAYTPAKPQSGDTSDESVYHIADGVQYDMKIEAGNVSVTLDKGASWISVPVGGGKLQDYWLSYYRMGNQSFTIDDEIIMISYAQKYYQPHIIVSTNKGKNWQDIRIDCGSTNIDQISLAKASDGGYLIAMMSGNVMFTGTSSDGIQWSFHEPVASSKSLREGMYSMALMKDGTILVTSYGDVAISKDHGKTYSHLKDIDPAIAEQIDYNQIAYEEDGTYCVPLINGIAKSKDGVTWSIA